MAANLAATVSTLAPAATCGQCGCKVSLKNVDAGENRVSFTIQLSVHGALCDAHLYQVLPGCAFIAQKLTGTCHQFTQDAMREEILSLVLQIVSTCLSFYPHGLNVDEIFVGWAVVSEMTNMVVWGLKPLPTAPHKTAVECGRLMSS